MSYEQQKILNIQMQKYEIMLKEILCVIKSMQHSLQTVDHQLKE